MLYWKSGRPELKASALTPESGGDSQFGQSAGPSQNRQDGHIRRCLELTGRNSAHVLICIGLTYILSSCVTGPVGPEAASEKWHWRSGPIYLGHPIVTSGDSPHYLLIVNSLLEDLDLDLANNHHQISLGDWDAGTRVRRTAFGGHVETDTEGRKLSFHPFFATSRTRSSGLALAGDRMGRIDLHLADNVRGLGWLYPVSQCHRRRA